MRISPHLSKPLHRLSPNPYVAGVTLAESPDQAGNAQAYSVSELAFALKRI